MRKSIQMRGMNLLHFMLITGIMLAAWFAWCAPLLEARNAQTVSLSVCACYMVFSIFLLRTYNAYKIGIFRAGEVFYAQTLANLFSNRKSNGDKAMQVTLDLFDMDWKPIPEIVSSGLERPGNGELPRPENLDEMIRIAKILSKDFKFVRVDLSIDTGSFIILNLLNCTHKRAETLIQGFSPFLFVLAES